MVFYIKNSKNITKGIQIPTSNCFVEPCVYRRGSLAILWKDGWNANIRDSNPTYIDALLSSPQDVEFRLTDFYGDPVPSNQVLSWEALVNLKMPDDPLWLVCGDFNEIFRDGEKLGRPLRNISQMENFIDAVADCNLNDLGSHGTLFSWSNRRKAADLVRELLDRMLANSYWYDMFPYAEVENLQWSGSDQCPLVLSTDEPNASSRRRRKPKRFFFEASSLKNED